MRSGLKYSAVNVVISFHFLLSAELRALRKRWVLGYWWGQGNHAAFSGLFQATDLIRSLFALCFGPPDRSDFAVRGSPFISRVRAKDIMWHVSIPDSSERLTLKPTCRSATPACAFLSTSLPLCWASQRTSWPSTPFWRRWGRNPPRSTSSSSTWPSLTSSSCCFCPSRCTRPWTTWGGSYPTPSAHSLVLSSSWPSTTAPSSSPPSASSATWA